MTHMNRFTVDMYTSLFHFILNQFSVKKKKWVKVSKLLSMWLERTKNSKISSLEQFWNLENCI